jgi:hypothetical protein
VLVPKINGSVFERSARPCSKNRMLMRVTSRKIIGYNFTRRRIQGMDKTTPSVISRAISRRHRFLSMIKENRFVSYFDQQSIFFPFNRNGPGTFGVVIGDN